MYQNCMFEGVLLDRDGTINVERRKYVRSIAEFVLLPRALDALACLAALDAAILVVTNQSCVGRGLLARPDLDAIHAHLQRAAQDAGGRIDGFYVCPHRPDEGCACRKPQPGLLLQAMAEHGLRPDRCLMIGDSATDAQAARAAGVRCILVRTGLQSALLPGRASLRDGAYLPGGAPAVRPELSSQDLDFPVVESLWHASNLIMEMARHPKQVSNAA